MVRGFAEQSLHYFHREHESPAPGPVGGPAAWLGSELARSDDWVVQLAAEETRELEAAIAVARASGVALEELAVEQFPLPGLAAEIARWRRELVDGRGFLLVRGLPVERWDEATASLAFWGLGLHLGVPGAQNPAGDLLGHVIDTGESASQPHVRRYRTAGDIRFHCDLADVVGLLCLRTARRGGASRIASSVAVHDRLLAERPNLVSRLYEPFALDLRDEGGRTGRSHLPVPPCRYARGRLRTFYHSDYFRSAVRHADVPAFTRDEAELLDRYEALAGSPELRLDMELAPGELQLVSNHTVIHARTAYEDGAAPRHLLRLWLSL